MKYNNKRHYRSLRKRREKEGAEVNMWKNNGWKLPKFNEIYESTYSRSSSNSKQDKHKEIHIETYYNQIVISQRQGENLESSKKKSNLLHTRDSQHV